MIHTAECIVRRMNGRFGTNQPTTHHQQVSAAGASRRGITRRSTRCKPARPTSKKNVDGGSSGALRTPPPTGQTLRSVRLSVRRQQPGYLLKWVVIACCATLVVITARLERTGGARNQGYTKPRPRRSKAFRYELMESCPPAILARVSRLLNSESRTDQIPISDDLR